MYESFGPPFAASVRLLLLVSSHDSLSRAQELVADILEVARNTGTNVCSMLADLRRGSR
jgi:hypothetical protein